MSIWQKLHNEWPTIAAALVTLAVAIGGLFGIDPGAIEDAGGEITQVVTAVLGFVAWLHVRRSIDGPVTRTQKPTPSGKSAGTVVVNVTADTTQLTESIAAATRELEAFEERRRRTLS